MVNIQAIILESTTPGNRVTIVRKKEVKDYLLEKGFTPTKDNGQEVTFFVENSYEVFEELSQKGFL